MADAKHKLSVEELEELVPELLYGELDDSRAEEVRAQLPEHELDGKVAAYERLREAFRSLPDEEPPPAISAQLLHAAAKQVEGKQRGESVGLWAKLRDWFSPVALHPGLAAAASILVVGGVVGVLYLKGSDQIAQPDVASRASAPEMAESTLAPATSAPAAEGRLGDNLNGLEVAKEQADKDDEAADAPAPPPPAKTEAKPEEKRANKKQRAGNRRSRPDKKDKNGFGATGKSTGLVGGLGDSSGRSDQGLGETVGPVTLGGAAGGDRGPANDPAPAPEPAPQGEAEPDDDAPAVPKASPKKKKSKSPSRSKGAKPDPHADARRLHAQARSAVEKGDCTSATKLMARIKKTDAVYYRDEVRGDRQLSKCRDTSKK